MPLNNRELRRCEILGRYIIDNRATVRDTAAKFGISKSTVHKDVTDRLKHCNHAMYELVREVLDTNKSERHLRGGEATKNKFILNSKIKRREYHISPNEMI